MTQSELKRAASIGAELGAAKAENEKLRGLLERIRTTCCQVRDAQDLDTAPGLSAAESLHEHIEKLDAALSQQPEPTDTYTAVDMATAAAQGFRYGQAAVEQAAVQDEKAAFDDWYPLGCPGAGVTAHLSARAGFRAGAAWQRTSPAQTAPQPEQSGKFAMGDLVKKSTGSEWEGRVVGWYSTEQTPEGYAVESSAHRNSVQIYPAKALEAVR